MATSFKLVVHHPEPVYARQAMAAAWTELDALEIRLSRFIEHGDLFRINRLAAGQSTTIHPDTARCLCIALEMTAAAQGAFDAAYAARRRHPAGPVVQVDCLPPHATALVDHPQLDLGAIGKGFALDCLAQLLAEWEIETALLCASQSTIYALGRPPGAPGWKVILEPGQELWLADGAFSASGLAVQGSHIFDPRTGRPVAGRCRAWSQASSAAEADALSTVFMVLSEPEILEFCRTRPSVSAFVKETEASPCRCLALAPQR